MKWNADVSFSLNIYYDDIEADTREEAESIAKERAYEDIDFNNCNCSDNAMAFCWLDEEICNIVRNGGKAGGIDERD